MLKPRKDRRHAGGRARRSSGAEIAPERRLAGAARPDVALAEAVPAFLSALRGYDRRQVDEWVRWQQQLLARSRQRALAAERERSALLGELEEALERLEAVHGPQLVVREGELVGARRPPRHLRRERLEESRKEA